jgi:hypothetical protein
MTVTCTPWHCTASNRNPRRPEQHDVIDLVCDFQSVDSKFDAHAPLELAASLAIVELLCSFRNQGKAIVVEPIDQRTDRGIWSSNIAV